MQTLTKEVTALEGDYEQTESRLQAANEKLELATQAADESERYRLIVTIRIATVVTALGPIYKISYDSLTIILRQCHIYDRLTTDV